VHSTPPLVLSRVTRILSVCPSVCLSVCCVPVFCENGRGPRDGPPEGGPPGKRGEEEKGRGGEGENCCHQMSDFTAKMRARAIKM